MDDEALSRRGWRDPVRDTTLVLVLIALVPTAAVLSERWDGIAIAAGFVALQIAPWRRAAPASWGRSRLDILDGGRLDRAAFLGVVLYAALVASWTPLLAVLGAACFLGLLV